MVVRDDQSRRRQEDSTSKPAPANFVPNKDIQFGYHSASGEQIRINNNGLRAERMDPDRVAGNGVAYGAHPLKGMAEFEIKIVSYETELIWSLGLGVIRCEKGVPIEPGPSIPIITDDAANHCVWIDTELYNNIVTPSEKSEYGDVNLDDLREGDCVGLRLSQNGVLEFFVNGESQGIAAKNIYIRSSDVYAVVDHYGKCVATVITKAGECSHI